MGLRRAVGIGMALLVILASMVAMAGCNPTGSEEEDNMAVDEIFGSQNTGSEDEPVDDSTGDDLVIQVADLSSEMKRYPVTVSGVDMEVIAMLDSAGQPIVAFNTCYTCADSGKGYFEQENGELVCQNCGNRYSVDGMQVNVDACSPVLVFDSYTPPAGDTIIVPYATLKANKSYFAYWKY